MDVSSVDAMDSMKQRVELPATPAVAPRKKCDPVSSKQGPTADATDAPLIQQLFSRRVSAAGAGADPCLTVCEIWRAAPEPRASAALKVSLVMPPRYVRRVRFATVGGASWAGLGGRAGGPPVRYRLTGVVRLAGLHFAASTPTQQ